MSDYYKISEVADMLGVTINVVKNAVHNRGLHDVRLNSTMIRNTRYVSVEDLDNYIRELTNKTIIGRYQEWCEKQNHTFPTNEAYQKALHTRIEELESENRKLKEIISNVRKEIDYE